MIQDDTQDSAARTLKILVIATVILYAVLIIAGTSGYFLLKHEGESQRRKLCIQDNATKQIFRLRLRDNIRESQEFLRDNPQGIPGFPPELILRGITNTDRQRHQLAGINCDIFASKDKIVKLPIEPLLPLRGEK